MAKSKETRADRNLDPNMESKASRRQWFAAVAAFLSLSLVATNWSYSSTALPSLRESGDISGLTPTAESWIASSQFIAAIVASPLAGMLADKKGLRYSMLVFAPFIVVGWVLVASAVNLAMIIAGRSISGFAATAVCVSAPSYVGEISAPERRGKLGIGYDFAFCVGWLFINVCGTFLNWRMQAVACGVLPILFIALTVKLPECPTSSIKLGNVNRARKTLYYYRGVSRRGETAVPDEVTTEFQGMAEQLKQAPSATTWKGTVANYLNVLTLRPVWLAIILQFYLQLSGAIPLAGYTVDIFTRTGTYAMNSYTATIIIATTNMVMTIAATQVVDRFGRRVMFMVSELGMSVSLCVLGTFLFFKHHSDSVVEEYGSLNWIPVVCFILFFTAFSFGVGPIPSIVLGEILPADVKGVGSGVVILAKQILAFAAMFTFHETQNLLGQHGFYWLFSAVCFSGIIFTYLCLPETKGKTLQEIQDELESTNYCLPLPYAAYAPVKVRDNARRKDDESTDPMQSTRPDHTQEIEMESVGPGKGIRKNSQSG